MKRMIAMFVTAVFCFCLYAAIPVQADSVGTAINKQEQDVNIIPDKYNTGYKGTLQSYEEAYCTMNAKYEKTNQDVEILFTNSGDYRILDFYYRNKDVTGTVVFENIDFSNYTLRIYNADKLEKAIHVIFKNCKFSGVGGFRSAKNLTFSFEHCTLQHFSGSNASFNRCKFGGSYKDGLVPFQNVNVNDCLFSDMSQMYSEGVAHVDCIQIYGYEDTPVKNVHINRCRFELPPVNMEGSQATVNACLMLQLEYNDASDVSFENCIVNGGGYTIYAHAVKNGSISEDVYFKNIQYGCASKYGLLYPDVTDSVTFTNMHMTDSLYIGSVWKDEDGTHLSVTNDTNQERKLVVVTNQGTFTYDIKACPKGNAMTTENTYDSLPFDMDITIPKDLDYVVCYDNTMEGNANQIRFMNWNVKDGKEVPVYIDADTMQTLTQDANGILLAGSCGKNVTFTLTKNGVLTLSGTGETDQFHSTKFPEWKEYGIYVKEVIVEEGITRIGNSIFRDCPAVRKVTLPDSLQSIGQYAFAGCTGIEELTLPPFIESIGANILSGVPIRDVFFYGDDWDAVQVDAKNDAFLNKVKHIRSITYVLNDSKDAIATHNNPSEYIAGKEIVLKPAVREGYTFNGWFIDKECTKKKETIEKNDKDCFTLYAKWTVIENDKESVQSGTNEPPKEETVQDDNKKVTKPKKVKGLKLKKSGKRNIKISWKRDKKVTGYQVVMRVGTKGKYKVIKTITKNKKTTYIKKKLKKKKKYYIKVRAYKKINGKKVYGPYCKAKRIIIK